MHHLPDHLFRSCINLIALAGQLDEDGRLGSAEDVAFHLRLDVAEAAKALAELEKIRVTFHKKDVWWLKNWTKRNGKPLSDTREAVRERVKKYRENKPIQDDVKRDGNAVTPALHSPRNAPRLDKNRKDKNTPSVAQTAPDEPDALKTLAATFEQASGVKLENIDKRQQGPIYWHPLGLMLKTGNGNAEGELRAAIAQLRQRGMTISSPKSVLNTFNSLHGAKVSPAAGGASEQLRELGYTDADGNPV
jgi:hypothetical protein